MSIRIRLLEDIEMKETKGMNEADNIEILSNMNSEDFINDKTYDAGMVLQGGAMRGMYTAGVLDVLMENKIWIKSFVGVSAGSCFGCNYKSRQIGRTIRYNKRFCKDKRYGSLWSLIRTGDVYDVKFCYDELPNNYDKFDMKTFRNNPVEFWSVSTDVDTGKPFYYKFKDFLGDEPMHMCASASMPVVSRVVRIDDKGYLDGGISDPIPLKFAQEEFGYKKNIVILTRDASYEEKPYRFMRTIKFCLRKYPKIVEQMAKGHELFANQVDYVLEQEKLGNCFVIRPSRPLTVSTTENDPEKLEETYQMGREDALNKLEKLREYLES